MDEHVEDVVDEDVGDERAQDVDGAEEHVAPACRTRLARLHYYFSQAGGGRGANS